MNPKEAIFDVAIVGGGPAGSTCASLIRKYNSSLSVVVLERERFPRDHVGESHLPPIGAILDEMGAWDKIEAANFPIKIGGTYRWGQTAELWDFEFLPLTHVVDEPRPAPYRGWRTRTAFQVDRPVYDKILLDHAAELGADVRQETQVRAVEREGDRVTGLRLQDGTLVRANYFVDCSGNVGLFRRELEIETDVVNDLKNLAFWDYWENADWAVEIGVGGTRIQVISLGYGWIWFIPISQTRTSVGLVIPSETFKARGETPEETYQQAVFEDPRIAALLRNAKPEGKFQATKDWSFVATRTAGENWFICGESAGFADPILSAGVTLAQVGARELAYTILELFRGELNAEWLKARFDENQRLRIWQHIRFATFWYTGNGRFSALKELTAEIAKDAGYEMDPNLAFKWFASGTFTNDSPTATLAHHSMATAKIIAQLITQSTVQWEVAKYNTLHVSFTGATEEFAAEYEGGRVQSVRCLRRDGRLVRFSNLNDLIFKGIQAESDVTKFFVLLQRHFQRYAKSASEVQERMIRLIEALEALLLEGWVKGSIRPGAAFIQMSTTTADGPIIHTNVDPRPEDILGAEALLADVLPAQALPVQALPAQALPVQALGVG